MRTLYPAIKPYVQHQLAVDERHTLHIEECGNPSGLPVVFLHGGPGAGCEPMQRRFFDPEIYRIVLFDQRGCGRSTPHAELTDNTTQHLVEDIETIREFLGIEKWIVEGRQFSEHRVETPVLRKVSDHDCPHRPGQEDVTPWDRLRLKQ